MNTQKMCKQQMPNAADVTGLNLSLANFKNLCNQASFFQFVIMKETKYNMKSMNIKKEIKP
ncbi:hypothetical protein BLOT_011625 [Blomia tropicalis]|nr:hypothetical protein BLOT_011625 [Blomia tropicalis]